MQPDNRRTSKIISFRNKKRIRKGKSTLVTGEIGFGKTKFLDQVRSDNLMSCKIESLGSLNYILVSILRQKKYRFTPKMHKSAAYLEAICGIKDTVIVIDDINHLRASIFPYVKKMMDSQIPIIMAGPPETETKLKQGNEEIFCRLKVLRLQPVNVKNLRNTFPQFAPDTLEVIFGYCLGNMWVLNELCDECLDKMLEKKLKEISMDIVRDVIAAYENN
ncbi:MAG: transposase (ATPase domain protein) [Candidatus Magnetoglobus multicellularis str. Araruama]|uniref:Transposase (ATPase domain protein) n=1 Tax=Candidatus Magnetoglobus multicellularis str. Araruama TaxID=890399 RepID=A0A1V1P033_9BACT|nr:MAG: transposase (ATPase domain protein) [Candidatus Magnetoglobus multicellularis str. Araruama]